MDQKLKETIDQIWEKYDKDKSGVLEGQEVDKFINDLCNCSDLKEQQASVKSLVDEDGNGKITKEEVYSLLTS